MNIKLYMLPGGIEIGMNFFYKDGYGIAKLGLVSW